MSHTKKQLLNLAYYKSTEKHFHPSKNSSKENKKVKGYFSETFVAAYLLNKGYQVLLQNWITPFGEIDLVILNKNNELILLEVKSQKNDLYSNIISRRQLNRQKRICEWLISFEIKVIWSLAVVQLDKQIKFFDSDLIL